jgi:hypothetical protein
MEIYVVTIPGGNQERDSNQQQDVYVGLQVAQQSITDILPCTIVWSAFARIRVTL